jgi:hypothetical protein
MATLLAVTAIAGLFGVVLGGLVLVARRVRRRGVGGGYSLMGPFEELWHPGALDARLEISTQEEGPAPTPSSGDRLV